MKLETQTLLVIGAATVGLALWDVYAKIKRPDGTATESWLMRAWAKRWPIVAVAWGVLTGHFFWPITPDCGQSVDSPKCINMALPEGSALVCQPVNGASSPLPPPTTHDIR